MEDCRTPEELGGSPDGSRERYGKRAILHSTHDTVPRLSCGRLPVSKVAAVTNQDPAGTFSRRGTAGQTAAWQAAENSERRSHTFLRWRYCAPSSSSGLVIQWFARHCVVRSVMARCTHLRQSPADDGASTLCRARRLSKHWGPFLDGLLHRRLFSAQLSQLLTAEKVERPGLGWGNIRLRAPA